MNFWRHALLDIVFAPGDNTVVQNLALVLLAVSSVFLPTFTNSPVSNPPGTPTPPLGTKNVILMISDGCGYTHVEATSMYQYGAAGGQVYDGFPVKLAMSTFSAEGWGYDPVLAWRNFGYVQHSATSSAAAATAISCGTKTLNAYIGFDVEARPLQHAMAHAEALGKSTGVVTTVPFCHATPAGFVAHNASRWNYEAIAQEMLLSSGTDVIMGTGHPFFDSDGQADDSPSYQYVGGKDTWEGLAAGTAGMDADGDGAPDRWTLVETREQFRALGSGNTPQRVCGVAQAGATLQQSRRGDGWAEPYAAPLNGNVPTLAEMTYAALNVLDNDPDGFFLMVEGGAIDWASHANQAGRMIEEQIDFNHAVEAVVSWTENKSNWCETLLIVTSDHETGYLTGPGSNPDWKPLVSRGKGAMPDLEWHTRDHTNQLVPFYAKGGPATEFEQRAVHRDRVRGAYLDNSDLAPIVLQWLNAPPGEACLQ